MDSSNDTLSGVTGSDGTQGTTNNPQQGSSTASSLNGNTSDLQTSISASNLLASNNGIALKNTNLPVTTLSTTSTGSTSQPTVNTTKIATHHGFNPVLLSISVVLFIVAVGMFVSTTRTAKTTTK